MVQPKFSVVFVIGDMRGAEKLEQLNRRHLHFEQHLRRDPEGAEDTTRHPMFPTHPWRGRGSCRARARSPRPSPTGCSRGSRGTPERRASSHKTAYKQNTPKKQVYPDASRVFRVENGGSGGRRRLAGEVCRCNDGLHPVHGWDGLAGAREELRGKKD